MSSIDTVFLDTLDGFQFEDLCAKIYDNLGFHVIQVLTTKDKGRDIIMKSHDGRKIIVECKHQPSSSIGRPIIQKLHSAVISESAHKGIVITSGKFSHEAIEHAKDLSKRTEIELVDLPMLIDLANRANIKISFRGESLQIFSFIVTEKNNLALKIAHVLSNIQSYPNKVRDIVEVIPINLQLKAIYLIKYDINQDFSTAAGVIHAIHKNNQFIMIDGETGRYVDSTIEKFVINAKLVDVKNIPSSYVTNRSNFKHDMVTIKELATNGIISKNTKSVHYTGNNNVGYNKICEPGPRSVFITDVKQVFLPLNTIHLKALRQHYNCSVVENDRTVLLTSTDVFQCRICNSKLDKGLLCNACGNIVHTPKMFGSHGFHCKNCQKTICKSCSYWIRRMLFFKKIICEICANRLIAKNKKINHLSP